MTWQIGSLCSGYGGLDVAVRELLGREGNARVRWGCEIDDRARKVWTGHFKVPCYRDLKAMDWQKVVGVDVLTAGYPCQPFSQAGKRMGVEDPRHLWPWIRDGIEVLRDRGLRAVFLENVPGHVKRGLDVVLDDLAELGFDAEWGTLGTWQVGGCHRRDRLWIVAVASEPDGVRTWRELGKVSREAGRGRREDGRVRAAGDAGELLATPSASDGRGGPRRQGRDGGANLRTQVVEIGPLIPTPTSRDGKGANQRADNTCLHGAVVASPWDKYLPAMENHARVIGRPFPSPTTIGTKGQAVLNPAFVEWMMMLDEGWVTGRGLVRTRELEMLGNGVVWPCALAAYRELIERRLPPRPGRKVGVR